MSRLVGSQIQAVAQKRASTIPEYQTLDLSTIGLLK